MDTDNNTELWRLPRVLAATGLSRSALYRLVTAGTFPKPVSLGGTAARGWKSTDVQRWIDQQS